MNSAARPVYILLYRPIYILYIMRLLAVKIKPDAGDKTDIKNFLKYREKTFDKMFYIVYDM